MSSYFSFFFFLSKGNPLRAFVEQRSTFVVWLTSVGKSEKSLISSDLGGADRSFNVVQTVTVCKLFKAGHEGDFYSKNVIFELYFTSIIRLQLFIIVIVS